MVDGISRPTLTFLLRLWAETNGDDWVWRASLHDLRGHELLGFPHLEAAMAFLQSAMVTEQSQIERVWRWRLLERNPK